MLNFTFCAKQFGRINDGNQAQTYKQQASIPISLLQILVYKTTSRCQTHSEQSELFCLIKPLS